MILGECFVVIKVNLIMTSFMVKRKIAVGKIAKPYGVPPSTIGPLLLLQPRATTVVTRSDWGSGNSHLYEEYKSLCLTNTGN